MGFKNVIVQQVVGGGGGAPTFIYNELPKRSDGIRLSPFRLSDQERRTDAIRGTYRLTDTEQRADAYRLPNVNFTINESERRREDLNFPLLRVSDQSQRTDKTTVSVLFTSPGTRNFIVPNGVSQMVMEAWGAGGGGGITGVTFGGGGGKGGAYARRNAQAVAAGQTLTVTVAPDANGNGQASSVSVAGGQFSVGSQTFTPALAPQQNRTVNGGVALFLQGNAVSFIAKTDLRGQSAPTGARTILIPPQTQQNDILILATFVSNNDTSDSISEFTLVYERIFNITSTAGVTGTAAFRIFCKVASASDANTQKQIHTGTGGNNDATTIQVYRGASFPTVESIVEPSAISPITIPGFSKNSGGVAVFVPHSMSDSSPASNSFSPSAGVVERSDVTGPNAGSAPNALISSNEAAVAAVVGATFVSAAGGNAGAPGVATGGGAGATAQNGTSTGDVTFTGGNGGSGGLTVGGDGGGGAGSQGNATGRTGRQELGGDGGGGATLIGGGSPALNFGGGGGGSGTLGPGSDGAQGAVRLTFTI